MKQLISIIKGQIQQLPIPDLKHLLLSHLKEDAHDLTELFCQQIPAQKNQFSLNHSVPFGLPASLSVLAIVLTYAPQSASPRVIRAVADNARFNKRDQNQC